MNQIETRQVATDDVKKEWSRLQAGILSLVLPGAAQMFYGQMYRGRVSIGFFWLLLVLFAYSRLIEVGFVLHLICVLSAVFVRPTTEEEARKTTRAIVLEVVGKSMKLAIMMYVALSLSFHYIPGRMIIFPKESLSFQNTFVLDEDVEKLLERHNNASGFERVAIRNEYLYQQLLDLRVITEAKDEEN